MKFNCGQSLEEDLADYEARVCRWHRWFAWRPVRVGKNDCRWLEYVERKAGWVGAGIITYLRPYDCKYRAVKEEE